MSEQEKSTKDPLRQEKAIRLMEVIAKAKGITLEQLSDQIIHKARLRKQQEKNHNPT